MSEATTAAISAVRSAYETAIEALKGEVTAKDVTIRALQTRAKQAEAAVTEARAEVEVLRSAEAERAGQGRWARLRTAWRGE
jgi:hypothetical protein